METPTQIGRSPEATLIGRREVLKAALGLGATLGALSMTRLRAMAQEKGPLLLAGLHPLSGPFAGTGLFAQRGVDLAIEERNGTVLGRPIEHVVRDTELKPAVAVRKAREVIEEMGAKFLIGTSGSHVALALSELAHEKKVLMMCPSAGSDRLTGDKCHKYIFRWTTPDWSIARSSTVPFLDQAGLVKSAYAIVANYAWGQSTLKITEAVLGERGVKLAGHSMAPLGAADFSSHILKARDSGTDAVIFINYGTDQVNALKQAREFDLAKNAKLLCVWSALEILREVGEAAEGVYFGVQAWHTVDTPVAKKVVRRYREKYKENPGDQTLGHYIFTKILLDTIEKVGSVDVEATIKRLEGLEYDGPTGRETLRAADHQCIKPFYLGVGKSKQEMTDREDILRILSGVKFYQDPRDSGCRM